MMMMYLKRVFALLVALFSTLVDSSVRQVETLESGDFKKSPVRRLTPQTRAVEDRFDLEARKRIDQMFNHQPADQESRVSVNATSPGSWRPTSECPTPKVWLFLVGKHREFGNVAPYIAKSMQESSSANCYFVAAVVPVENEIDVQASLAEAQNGVFHGRMSFIILERHGIYERWRPPMTKDFIPPNSYLKQGSMLTRIPPHDNETSKMMMRRLDSQNLQPALDVFWWSSYLCAVLAQEAHGIVPMPHSVVLRIRPDIILKRAFDFTNLMLYFEKGQRGKHLAFSGEGWPAFGLQRYQADYFLLTSYQAYKTDIALALEQGKISTSLSRSNGWGYGWSICGWQSLTTGPGGQAAARCAAGGGGACGMTIVGPPVEIEQLFNITGDKDHPVQFTNSESKNRLLELYHSDMPLLDPTQNIILYCPVPQEGYSVRRVWLEKMWQGSCSLDGYGPEPVELRGEKKSFYISGQLHNLMQDGLPREPWPQDC